jgi:hypothetical protein
LGASATGIKELPLVMSMDMTMPNDNDFYLALGTEYTIKKMLALRMGYIGSNDEGKGLRMGVGLMWQNFSFDYAYGGFGDFGATHRFGLTLKFGESVEKLNKDQRSVLKEARNAQKRGDYTLAMEHYRELTENNPDSAYLMRQMVRAHESMTGMERAEQVKTAQKETPSLEDVALQDLVPNEEAVAAVPGAAKFGPQGSAIDYIGETNLPGIDQIDAMYMATPVETPVTPVTDNAVKSSTLAPEPMIGDAMNTYESNNPASLTTPNASAAGSDTGAALSPTDIYE